MISKSEAKKEIDELKKIIEEQNYNYYVLANPKISDFEFDDLLKKLISLENQFPDLITTDSPSQKVGGEVSKKFPVVKHDTPMLSLANAYSFEDLREFENRIKKILGNEIFQFVCELKIDGVSLSAKYVNGSLSQAATRGDGETGEVITNNAKTIKSLPLKIKKINDEHLNFEVRGEVFMEKNDFNEMNIERNAKGEKLFANPRNSTAGTLKLLDPKQVANRPLKIFLYNLKSKNLKFHSESLNILSKLGFVVNKNYKICKSIDEVISYCKKWNDDRNKLEYEIDGVVVKIDSLDQQEKIGSIAKSPRWAIAYKFPAEKIFTKINGITLQVGRLGTITPVAELEPVLLAGSVISRATLHNEDFINQMDIRIGDFVQIEKSGDVIPKVVSNDLNRRSVDSKKFRFPKNCPVCNSKLSRIIDEAAYYCSNFNCFAQICGRIEHFAHRGAMDIEGLGEAVVKLLVNEKLIIDSADLYNLKIEQLSPLERMGDKSAQNLINSIDKSKSQELWKLIFGLGIKNVGNVAAKKLANKFTSIENISNLSFDDFFTEDDKSQIDGIGEQIANSVVDFFKQTSNKKLIEKLKSAGVNLKNEKTYSNSKFQNLSFVLTGSLNSMSRDEATKKIELFGGKVVSSVSKKTSYVILGENPGSKLSNAEKLGVKILSEDDFLKLLNQ